MIMFSCLKTGGEHQSDNSNISGADRRIVILTFFISLRQLERIYNSGQRLRRRPLLVVMPNRYAAFFT